MGSQAACDLWCQVCSMSDHSNQTLITYNWLGWKSGLSGAGNLLGVQLHSTTKTLHRGTQRKIHNYTRMAATIHSAKLLIMYKLLIILSYLDRNHENLMRWWWKWWYHDVMMKMMKMMILWSDDEKDDHIMWWWKWWCYKMMMNMKISRCNDELVGFMMWLWKCRCYGATVSMNFLSNDGEHENLMK